MDGSPQEHVTKSNLNFNRTAQSDSTGTFSTEELLTSEENSATRRDTSVGQGYNSFVTANDQLINSITPLVGLVLCIYQGEFQAFLNNDVFSTYLRK